MKPAAATQLFADAEPSYVFADENRRATLVAAMPKVDAAITAEMASQNIPGLAIGVVIDGELAYAKGYGVVDLDSKKTPDAETGYRIGSISKSFAALGLLALRDEGVVRLDDPLVKWIPEASQLIYPTHDSQPITLRQLVTHTSGLVRDADFKKTSTEQEFLAQLHAMPLGHVPGQVFEYSNLGFGLVGIVVARASHSASISEAINKRVFKPLGMTASAFDLSPSLAPAYEPDNHTRKAEIERLGVAGGAGAIVSTVHDMATYVAFELSAYPPRGGDDHGVVRRSTIREAHATGFMAGASMRPHPDAKRGEPTLELDATTYGFGWQHHNTCDFDDLVEHGGAIDSYRASVQLLTQHGVGVVVLSNFGNANTYRIGKRILDELRATGALQPYVARPKLVPGFDAAVEKFLAVYNDWNEATFKTVLARPMNPVEPEEMTGYFKRHGHCTRGSVKEARTPTEATVNMTCERGQLEMGIEIAPDGRIAGFLGISRRLPVPPGVATSAKAWIALLDHWDEGVFAGTFLANQHGDVKRSASVIHADVGACKIGEITNEGIGWGFDTTCEHGKIHFSFELDHGKIKSTAARKLSGETCPLKK